MPKPEIPPNERIALHNVTSALYNKESVRQATERAIVAVCGALNVPVPDKTMRTRKNKRAGKEEQPSDRIPSPQAPINLSTAGERVASDEDSVFEGFGTDVDESSPTVDEPVGEVDPAEEVEVSMYDHLLGSSSEDEGDEVEEERLARFKGRETVNLDDISLSDSLSGDDSGENSESASELTSSPSVAEQSKAGVKQPAASARTGVIKGSTFLPSLMGGYISGSESASDIEEARPRKRRGQRARQAIWEKKYGASAKHLQKESRAGGRDAGWDMRRGAVDGDVRDRKTPWKKGVSNPSARSGQGVGIATRDEAFGKPTSRPTKRDDQGPLHPSWAAKKKAQDAQKNASFSGRKIVFD